MDKNNRYTIIPLAWPETLVSGVGEWYEKLFLWLGIIKTPIYKVGHAALLIRDQQNGTYNYLDFGRYETKKGYGRIRNAYSDPELRIAANQNTTLADVLETLSQNEATHGDGKLLAIKISNINSIALERVLNKYSDNKVHPYSPHKFFALNCSRFVQDVVAHTIDNSFLRLFFYFLPVKYLYTGAYLRFLSVVLKQEVLVQEASLEAHAGSDEFEYKIEAKMKDIGFQFLKGIGSSSWFKLRHQGDEVYRIERKNDKAVTTFNSDFCLVDAHDFDVQKAFRFTYPCDAEVCSVIQAGRVFDFKRLEKNIQLYQSPKEMPKARAVSIK